MDNDETALSPPPIFDGKSDWNPLMWRGGEHVWNELGASEWNIAHVRNAINSYGGVPEKHHKQSVELMDYVLSDLINSKRDFADLQKLYRECSALREDIEASLKKNDIVRCLALLDQWKSGDRKWRSI